jgi:tetratricopeptide (TPR) repeat protein
VSQLNRGRLVRAERLAELGRYEEAAQLYRQAAAEDPHDAETLCGLAISLVQLGQSAGALDAAEAAASVDPRGEWPHRIRSHILLRQGDSKEALAAAEAAVQLAPDGFLPHVSLFDAQLAMRQRAAATATAGRLEQLDPGHLLTHRSLGRLALVRHRARRAETHFREALRIKADDATTLSLLGRALELQHRSTGAIRLHHLAVQSDPRSQLARLALMRATRNHLGLTVTLTTAGLAAGLAVIAQRASQLSLEGLQVLLLASLSVVVILAGLAALLRALLWRRLHPQVRTFYLSELRAARRRSRRPAYLAMAVVLVILLTFGVVSLLVALRAGLAPVALAGFTGLLAASVLTGARQRLG